MSQQNELPTFRADCPCPKNTCERHGHCDLCRAYHATDGKRPSYCLRKKSLWARLLGRK